MTSIGEAGPRGDSVRSDAYVTVEPRAQGGLALELTSKVMTLYGARLRACVEQGLRELGVVHARVVVEDQGALDWVLQARLECAVRRAGLPVERPLLPPLRAGERPPSRRDRMRRSRLYLPGNGPKLMLSASLYGADGLILDLEDSVAPAAKDAARVLVRNALRQLPFGGSERMVRINQGALGLADLDAIAAERVDCVLLPKAESADDVRAVDAKLREHLGPDHGVWLMPIIESARGALRALDVATASPAVVALAIGLEDYTADIGAQRTLEGRESFWARSQVLNAARAAGVQPIDTVFSDVADLDGLLQSVHEAKGLGFEGKGCIHPRQIRVVHQGFAPAPAEVERAQKIVRAFDDAARRGLGVVALGSKMIDPPVVKRALRQVELAEAVGLLQPGWREAAAV